MEELKLLTTKDVMKVLNIGKTQMYNLLHKGEIKSTMVGRYFRIHEEDLVKYLEKNSKKIE